MGQTILIAEDDMDIVELLSLYLSGEGYRILSAVDGQQALALMETQKVGPGHPGHYDAWDERL